MTTLIDSPLDYCRFSRVYVLLDQPLARCREEHRCTVQPCPLAPWFHEDWACHRAPPAGAGERRGRARYAP